MKPWTKLNRKQAILGQTVSAKQLMSLLGGSYALHSHIALFLQKKLQMLAKICLSFHATVLTMSKNQLWGVNKMSLCSQSLLHRIQADVVPRLWRQTHTGKRMKWSTSTAHPFPLLMPHNTTPLRPTTDNQEAQYNLTQVYGTEVKCVSNITPSAGIVLNKKPIRSHESDFKRIQKSWRLEPAWS